MGDEFIGWLVNGLMLDVGLHMATAKNGPSKFGD